MADPQPLRIVVPGTPRMVVAPEDRPSTVVPSSSLRIVLSGQQGPPGPPGPASVTSPDITTIDRVTQAEYNALSPPDPTTLYVIVPE